MFSIDLVSLVGLVKSLRNKTKEERRDFFETYVNPVWSEVEKSHKDYIRSFRKYSDMVTVDECTVAAIIEEIRRDSLFSEDFRNRAGNYLMELMSVTHITFDEQYEEYPFDLSDRWLFGTRSWDKGKSKEYRAIVEFIFAIGDYFNNRVFIAIQANYLSEKLGGTPLPDKKRQWMGMLINRARYDAIIHYSRHGIEDKETALKIFDDIVKSIQAGHARAHQAYMKVRRELLPIKRRTFFRLRF